MHRVTWILPVLLTVSIEAKAIQFCPLIDPNEPNGYQANVFSGSPGINGGNIKFLSLTPILIINGLADSFRVLMEIQVPAEKTWRVALTLL